MSDVSLKFWDSEPSFRDDVSEGDAHLLRRTVYKMLASLWPASATWQVQYHSGHYVLGCQVPPDVKITIDNLRAGPNVSTGGSSWIEWKNDKFLLCCKVLKDGVTSGEKRKRT
jgi:hypothetical protein